MKRRTKRGLLFLSFAVLAGAWLVAAYRMQLDEESARPAAAEAAGFDLSIGTQKEITALSWAWNGQTVNLARDAQGRWKNADDPDCPVSNGAAGNLARAAAAVSASMAVADVTEFSQYGLDEPGLTVMAAAGDRIVTYEIGNLSIRGEYYLRMDKGDTVYLEDGGLAAAFRTGLTSVLETESLPGDIGEVTGLKVRTDAQSYTLSLSSDGAWTRDGSAALETAPVNDLISLVLGTDFSDCVGWKLWKNCGFDDPQGTVELSYRTEEGEAASFTLEYGAYEGRSVYVRFKGSELYYRVSASALDALMYPDWDGMIPLTVMDVDPNALSALTIRRGEETYEILRLVEDDESEAVYSLGGLLLDTRQAEKWLADLSSLTAIGKASAQMGSEELFSLTLALSVVPAEDGEEAEEPPEESAATLSVWLYDSTRALCVTGEDQLLISREEALSLAEELDAFLTPAANGL